MHRIRLLALALTLAALIVVACAPSGRTGGRVSLKIGVIPITDLMPYHVAKAKGYFDEVGIDVTELPLPGGAAIGPALESGELNIGWSNVVTLAAAQLRGADWAILSPGSFSDVKGHMQVEVMVPRTSTVTSARDLEGKKVAVNTRANITELGVRAWARRAGADPDRFAWQEVPFPQMEQALVSGQVDAGFVIEPWLTRAREGSSLRVLDPPGPWGYVADRFMIASWFAKKSWADQNPDTTDRFVRAILKAYRFVAENEAEARRIFAQAINLDEGTASRMIVPLWPERWSKTDLDPVIAAAVREKMLDRAVPAEQMVLPSAGMSR